MTIHPKVDDAPSIDSYVQLMMKKQRLRSTTLLVAMSIPGARHQPMEPRMTTPNRVRLSRFPVRLLAIVATFSMLAVACAGSDAEDSSQDSTAAEVETAEDGNGEPTDDAEVDDEPTEDSAPETVPPVTADDIPVAQTPPGGYGDVMPAPVLSGCTEPLSDEVVDMRGMWQIVGPENEGDVATGAVQRIEQCGNRMVITSGGVVHDMRVDGTLDNGVNDVAASDLTTPVRVAAFWEDGVHVLRPDGVPIEVTRHLDGDQLIWRYVDFSARLDRIGPVDMEA